MIIIKTLIELFDECQIENVMSALAYEPEKIIYIGFKNVMTSSRKDALEHFFRMRRLKSKISYEIVSRYDYDDIKKRLYSILEQNDDCVLDLTGGKELVLTAMGAVSENQNIPAVQFDIRRGEVIGINNYTHLPQPKKIEISINEYITLSGGTVIENPHEQNLFSLSDEFLNDIEKAWEIRKNHPLEWNSMIASLRSLENMGGERNITSAEIDMRRAKEEREIIHIHLDTITPFIKAGFVAVKKRGEHTLIIQHKNKAVHHMLLKIGNIFELYTYAAANEISKSNGGCYNDIGIGVYVDWDGILHPYGSYTPDTTNEVDVILIKGALPIFISCKSGDLKKEALYELDTVANKFGGVHAKKIIVATHISRNDATRDVILQRARDMHIDIISDTDIISKDEFMKKLAEKAK